MLRGAIEFAEDIGFPPHKDFEISKYILEEDDEKIDLVEIEFGYDGKPLYISTPENHSESRRVMAHLEKRLGRENFFFIKEAEMDDFMAGNEQSDDEKGDDMTMTDDVHPER